MVGALVGFVATFLLMMKREGGKRRRTKKGLDSELSSNSRGDFSRLSIVKAVI